MDEVLRDLAVIGEELFGVFGQAVAAVAEGRVVVVVPMRGSRQTPSMICLVSRPWVAA